MGHNRYRGAGPPVVILDGRDLAGARKAELARRAGVVTALRGSPPRLVLVAFAPDRVQPASIARKVRACVAVGVDATPMVLSSRIGSEQACKAVHELASADADGVFLEFPFPGHIDEALLVGAVPERLDLDVMTPQRMHRYLDEGVGCPPATVEAALVLLDAWGVPISGLEGVVVAETSPFAHMFREALGRRGARMRALVAPGMATEGVRGANLVVAAAAMPGLLRSDQLGAGAVVIDAGYYNPGGRGDIDTAPGVSHLRALAPVPGALGPMTVSVLVERVVEAAEAASGIRHSQE